ncbi:MAG TPA: hypothetical protein VD814_00855 [Nocardioides sp.]|nr:hypothetical protein [Nocardioides sp.]
MTTTAPSTALAVRRWAVIAAAGLSGVLVFVSMLVDPAPSADGRELAAAYAADTAASGLHTNLIHYGFALVAPVVYVLVGMVRGRGGWLANIAGLLAVIGLSTLPGMVMLDLTTTAAVQVTDVDTAYAIEQQLGERLSFLAIVIPAFVSSVLALPLAVAALWRARLVHGGIVLAGLAAAVAPNLLPWWLGFGANMVWMLGLALVLWRLPLSAWTGRAGAATAPVEERVPAL